MKTATESKCCKNGHARTAASTYVDSHGNKSCNQCRLDRARKQYEAVKETRSLERRAENLFKKYSMEEILKLAAIYEAKQARVASVK